jgi:hypothetical protein
MLEGERWILYESLKRYYSHDESCKLMFEFLYLYLLIKARIRPEFIQANGRYGFDNFQKHDSRKHNLLPDNKLFRKKIYYYSICDTLKTQSLLSLEARVTPRNTIEELFGLIKELEDATMVDKIPSKDGPSLLESIKEELKIKPPAKKFNKDLFYVITFPKRPDSNLADLTKMYKKKNIPPLTSCRHETYRMQLRNCAEVIVKLRNEARYAASKIYGIDACSNEITCRPEVFAVAYRYLHGHKVTNNIYYDNELLDGGQNRPGRLKMTYHVGEDFYDIVDGLRAIEEAVRFLCLGEGARLGHALALGTEVRDWYQSKRMMVMLPRHELIDNLAWMYSRINKYSIPGCAAFCNRIEGKFKQHFAMVYEKMDNHRSECGTLQSSLSSSDVTIDDYFSAWKLRGHCPSLYKSGKLVQETKLNVWDNYLKNPTYGNDTISPKAENLYYRYHYDSHVKVMGTRSVHFDIEDEYVEVVEQLQTHMQKWVSGKHIGIETNPSSNVLIGRIERYDKHPIQKWYNVGLTSDRELLKTSPQSFISINTDDQGVFNTCLENEYALLACALEKKTDENGAPIYNQAQIYEWLENIRRMGLQQSFRLIDLIEKRAN